MTFSKKNRSLKRDAKRDVLRATIASVLLIASPYALSQSVSATLRGQVSADAAPATGATVTATNTATGLTRSVQTGTGGSYSLAGLPPGEYKIDVNAGGKTSSQVVVLQVGQVATLDLTTGETPARNLESVTVSATRLFDARTSEVATYVSLKQIEALPQNSRNFLAFADTVPGVQFLTKGDGSTEVRAGAQAANGVNVFIDGVGQKSYVLRGGVSGQATSRGNPFPQLAIGEYKVITSNFKAEFDQLSSAAIVAATRSGTNEFESEGFWDRTSENWRASDPIEARAGEKAESEQEQFGVAFGGPIIRDRMHFFVTYENKQFESPKTVSLGRGIQPPTSGPLADLLGITSAPFEQDLYFGKIDWSIGDEHLLELTAKRRDESEIDGFGDQNTRSYGNKKNNEDTRFDLRHQYTGTHFLNDAHITYEDVRFNPRPVTIGPGLRYTTGSRGDVVINLGGGENYQDKGQEGWAFQNDLTLNEFEWLGGVHTVKTGVKYKQVEVNAFEQQPFNPQFYFDINNDLATPYLVEFGAAIPGLPERNVTSRNKQFGIYVQDDWEVNEKLLLNLGVRWDYEETPSYLDFVTPADIVAGINAIDNRAGAAPGQTYAQTLARGGIDINDYISTGNNRDAFDGAIQPRLGFSYDLAGDERHVIFGGLGRAYDRNVFDYLAVERSKGTFPRYSRAINSLGHPCTPGVGDCIAFDPALFDRANLEALVAANPSLGREVNLINNDLKTPYSDQISLGIRNRVEMFSSDWNTSAAVTYTESDDGIVFLLANRYPDGSFRNVPGATWGGQPWGNGIPGLGTLLIAKNGLKTRATALMLQAEKPYSNSSPWSVTLAYTYTDAKENRSNIATLDEHFIFDYPDVSGFGWHASTGVPRHRLVGTGVVDGPWDTTISAKLTLSTPYEYEAVNCFNTTDPANHCFFQNFEPDTTFGFRQLDLALQKEWRIWEEFSVRLRTDILNVLNHENADRYNTFRGNFPTANPNYGDIEAYQQPTRTFKLSLSASWR